MDKKDKDYIQDLWSKIFRQSDLMDKVVEWLENEVYDGAEVVAEYENEDHPDGQRPKCTDGTDDIIYGRSECAESLLNQIKKWQGE
jgi:hypothetical protein